MKIPESGETLLIPVSASPGAFPDEYLISLDTLDGPISGFIRSDEVKEIEGEKFIEGRVLDASQDGIRVVIHGSYFTTTGLAHISKEVAFRPAA